MDGFPTNLNLGHALFSLVTLDRRAIKTMLRRLSFESVKGLAVCHIFLHRVVTDNFSFLTVAADFLFDIHTAILLKVVHDGANGIVLHGVLISYL